MNLWITKYDNESFSQDYINKLENYVQDAPQLSEFEKTVFSNHNFHFLSFSSAHTPKEYNLFNSEELSGYSGLLIDKSLECRDLRDIRNVNVYNPKDYYGQFSLYHLKDSFQCYTDVLGFHKVFYGQKDGKIYISNSFEFLNTLKVFDVNTHQMLKDYSTSRFGIFPGYNTLLEDVFTLPEYGGVRISKDGKLSLIPYKNISELLLPTGNFESKLKETVEDYKTITHYLMTYHHAAIGLSGGFDGRLILNMFHNTDKKKLETYTYNRAGNLDLHIAKILSKKAGVKHEKFVLKSQAQDIDFQVTPFKDSSKDAFYISLREMLKDFYKINSEFKVILGGNGGDTDWEFGEKRIAGVDKSNIHNFIKDYSKMMGNHPIFNNEIKKKYTSEIENYLLEKYSFFSVKENWQQLLASAFFHLERFRGQQGFIYTQVSNKFHDIFAPFAIESFNQLLFLSEKSQLQRGLREGIHYRLSKSLTNDNIPFAPIITSAIANEHGNNFFQNLSNKIAPYLPKIIWKLNNGDTNTRIRKNYQSKVNLIYKEFIINNSNSDIYNLINKEIILGEVSKPDYNGKYNQIGSMIKTINDHNS